jgi:hypothetical protein
MIWLAKAVEELISVCFTSMTNRDNVNDLTPVVQRVDYTVVAKTNASEILSTLEFLTSGRPRLRSQGFNLRKESFNQLGRQFLQFFSGGTTEGDRVLSHGVFPNGSSVAGH